MMKRLQTPPPPHELANGQLLSPPLTGGLGKRVRFAAEDPETRTPKRFARSHQLEESGLANYTEIQDFSDEDQELSISDVSSEKSGNLSPPTTDSSLAANVSNPGVRIILYARRGAIFRLEVLLNPTSRSLHRISSRASPQSPKLRLSPSHSPS